MQMFLRSWCPVLFFVADEYRRHVLVLVTDAPCSVTCMQGALIEILEGQGIDNIAVCAAVQAAAMQPVGQLLTEAVQEDQRCASS